jgi:hypothetical protein
MTTNGRCSCGPGKMRNARQFGVAGRWLILAGVVSIFGANAIAQAVPSAESILDRYVAVTGGKAAYQAQTSQVMRGTIAIPEAGVSGRFTRYSALPDKSYEVVEAERIGKVESGFIDGFAWSKDAFNGPRIKSGGEKEQERREAYFNLDIRWRELYGKATTAGTETTEGEECYRVVLTSKTGNPETQYFSRKTGLRVKTSRSYVSAQGEFAVETVFTDYQPFGGVLIPTHYRQTIGTTQEEVTFTDIRVNESIPAERFDPPADIKALVPNAKH